MREIHLSDEAKKKIIKQSVWYRENRGESYVRTMMKNIYKDISTLSAMPEVGRPFMKLDEIQLYKIPSKKKAVIIYNFTDEDLYVTDIVFTATNH